MIKEWINKFKEFFEADNVKNFQDQLIKIFNIKKIPFNYYHHIINVSIILFSYLISSLIIYPEFKFTQFLKEIFSIFCMYTAIFFWFMEKFSENNMMKICLAVTTCLAPVIFTNNVFSVSIVCLLFLIIFQYIIFSYIQGCNLFSKNIPVYLILEKFSDLNSELAKKYKILELILLSSEENRNIKLSTIESIDALEKRLEKISRIPFFPTPRKFLYCAAHPNSENIQKLLGISAKYSVPLYKVMSTENDNGLCPITLNDTENFPTIFEKNPLGNIFKNKNIWICFDGRKTVADLICMISNISTANLTIICESASLVTEIQQELSQKSNFKNYKIKVIDLNFLCMSEAAPDILFYNIPVKSHYSNEDHLKEALVKNVIDTDKFIKLVQEFKIPMTFVLSSTGAANANNWTGATQRLGELLFQHADFHFRKTFSKFRVIRIPENASDNHGFLGEIISSMIVSGCIYVNSSESELNNLYSSKEILSLLMKAIVLAYKSESSAEVLTLSPKEKIDAKILIKNVCDLFNLKEDRDIQIVYNHKNEIMELDNFPNISEQQEKTVIQNIFCTKFIAAAIASYNQTWSIEEISKMNPRDIISLVFQSLSEKISPKNN